MKIATWNVNSLTVRLPQVLEWLALHQVDVLCLQETKINDEKFPLLPFAEAGYHVRFWGQKTYNGVALISREPLDQIARNNPFFEDSQTRILSANLGSIRIVNAYFPNGQSPDSEKFIYKMNWLSALTQWLAQELVNTPQLILLGDYNIAPEDRDVHDPVAWAGQILCTPQEREHFQALLKLGLIDAFRLFEQPAKSWSWWDYRQLAFRRNQGLRIDHILVSEPLQNQVTACWIDKEPRKNERPSDHAPVVIELNLN
jgi:exodeoxyribonuclease III